MKIMIHFLVRFAALDTLKYAYNFTQFYNTEMCISLNLRIYLEHHFEFVYLFPFFILNTILGDLKSLKISYLPFPTHRF